MAAPLPDLVVFDLDGTLIDSRRDLATAANRLIRELDGTPLDERTLTGMIGEGVRSLVERALAAGCGMGPVEDEHVSRFREIYAGCLLDNTLPYPGVREVLRTLRREAPLAVLTNKPIEATTTILDGLALDDMLDGVIGDGSGFARKPDPEGLEALMAEAGASPDDALLVGDSIVDLDTAVRAGTPVALACYGYGFASVPRERLGGKEVLLDRPADLLRLFGL